MHESVQKILYSPNRNIIDQRNHQRPIISINNIILSGLEQIQSQILVNVLSSIGNACKLLRNIHN